MRAAIVLLLVAQAAASELPIGLRAGADTGAPLIGLGLTEEVVGVRHILEYPVWLLSPFVGAWLDLKGTTYSMDLAVPLYWELDCSDQYCDRFDQPAFALRLGLREGRAPVGYTLALQGAETLLLVPSVHYDLSPGTLVPALSFSLPVAPSAYGVGVAAVAAIGLRYGR